MNSSKKQHAAAPRNIFYDYLNGFIICYASMGIIRLLLTLSVVAGHCGPIFGLTFVNGQIAVHSFYMITGFYMSLVLNEKYTGFNNSYRLFVTNRLMRLFPVYWAVLLATILVCVGIAVLTKGQSMPKFENYMAVKTNIFSFTYLVLTNLLVLGQDLVMFLGISPDSGRLFFTSNFWNTHPPLHSFLLIPQAWSLGLDMVFYFIAPLILKRGYKIVLVLLGASLLLRLYIYNGLGLQHDPWSYRFFPTELLFFLLGYLGYRLYLRIRGMAISKAANVCIMALIVSFTIVYPYLPDMEIPYFSFSCKECLYFLAMVGSIPVLFNFLKGSRLDNQVGELSYPVYLSHILVAMVCARLPWFPITSGWGVAAATLIFSFMLNRFIASPIEKYRQARLKK